MPEGEKQIREARDRDDNAEKQRGTGSPMSEARMGLGGASESYALRTRSPKRAWRDFDVVT